MNLFVFKKPGDNNIYSGASENILYGFHKDCFTIGDFEGNINSFISIPHDISIELNEVDSVLASSPKSETAGRSSKFPESSTSRSEHILLVEKIINLINNREIEKCVAARAIVKEGKVNLSKTFERLCDAYPDAFVFLFHTSVSGTWIGASPELLLKSEGNKFASMSLAGTRATGCTADWSSKDCYEQEIVTRYISGKFSEFGMKVSTSLPQTKQAGPVEHLMTIVNGYLQTGSDNYDISSLLHSLYPTPALCGYPKEKSIEIIKKEENFSRGYYGGFCGWTDKNSDVEIYVNLRSMLVEPNRYCIFAGGGIVKDSIPEYEWQETERKSETLLNRISLA